MNAIDKDTVTLELAGASVTISAAVLAELWLDKLRGKPAGVTGPEPRIGAALDGGIYAGIARGENGQPDHHLILLDEAPKRLSWKKALEWAKSIGADLPTRSESALLYANLRDLFQTDWWYWTSTQSAGDEAYAWIQDFDFGDQIIDRKGDDYRARAVRRVPFTTEG